MEELPKTDQNEEIKKLIKENIELNKEILRLTKKNNSILNMQRVVGFLKLLLILIPIILGFIYLPPLLEKAVNFYQELFGMGEGASGFSPKNIKNVIPGL